MENLCFSIIYTHFILISTLFYTKISLDSPRLCFCFQFPVLDGKKKLKHFSTSRYFLRFFNCKEKVRKENKREEKRKIEVLKKTRMFSKKLFKLTFHPRWKEKNDSKSFLLKTFLLHFFWCETCFIVFYERGDYKEKVLEILWDSMLRSKKIWRKYSQLVLIGWTRQGRQGEKKKLKLN